MATQRQGFALDPVTFEVLKNSFITSVDQMAEQILRTCYSFVIYNRDFSSALHDVERQFGRAGQPGHRGARRHAALHVQGRDPLLSRRHASGRRLRDQRSLCRRHAFSRRAADPPDVRRRQDRSPSRSRTATGPTSAAACRARSMSPARDMFREGIRITPGPAVGQGRFCRDVAHLIAANTRDPASIIGDMHVPGRGDAGCRARDSAARR